VVDQVKQVYSDISVIICAYTQQRWQDLVEAVASVRRQTLLPLEIIVVVDHNPALLAQVQEQLDGVIAVQNDEQQGLSGARNSGIAQARGRLLAFLDDDALAAPDWLQQLQEAFTDPHVLGAGGPVLPRWLAHKPDWLPPEFYWVVGCTYLGLPTTVSVVRNPIGANMCFRSVIFTTVGGFRNGIGRVGTRPVGCEETELCIRAHQRWPDHYFLYLPAATVEHRVPPQRATWRYFFARCYAEGISKAFIGRFVGARDSLSAERTYTTRTLPLGVLRNLAAPFSRRDLAGLARAAAIVSGLAATTGGYIVGRLFARASMSEDKSAVVPEAVPVPLEPL